MICLYHNKRERGERMLKITVEGQPKEIAALALELQERRGKLVEVTKRDTYDLVIENDQARDFHTVIRTIFDRNVR